jgi:8-oxo-dGTP pyrophosphatase MutT (NUDIX family)
MGQRGASAAFMPNKFVFPGGAVDAEDAVVPLATPLPPVCADRLTEDAPADLAHALAVAAIRELWEETGLILGQRGTWDQPPPADWTSFAATGHLPSAEALQFVFRAITPPGRPRRFDARFFLVDAEAVSTDLDDFDAAADELSHLQWIPLPKVREFDLPFITEVVLAEVALRAHDPAPPESIPFFRNNDEESLFLRLKGSVPQQGRSD